MTDTILNRRFWPTLRDSFSLLLGNSYVNWILLFGLGFLYQEWVLYLSATNPRALDNPQTAGSFLFLISIVFYPLFFLDRPRIGIVKQYTSYLRSFARLIYSSICIGAIFAVVIGFVYLLFVLISGGELFPQESKFPQGVMIFAFVPFALVLYFGLFLSFPLDSERLSLGVADGVIKKPWLYFVGLGGAFWYALLIRLLIGLPIYLAISFLSTYAPNYELFRALLVVEGCLTIALSIVTIRVIRRKEVYWHL